MFEKYAKDIAIKLLGEPNLKLSKDTELRWGNFGSMSVNLEKATFFCHETGSGGGIVDLIKHQDHDPKKFLDGMGLNEEFREIPRNSMAVVARYTYQDAENNDSYEVIRYHPKTFRQRKYDAISKKWVNGISGVTPLPYNLPEILTRKDEVIYLVEGEKDADFLMEKGLLASCNSGGANNWKSALNEHFRGREIVILPDLDEVGEKHGKLVASELKEVAKNIKIVTLPLKEKEDVFDFFQNGGSIDDFKKLVSTTQIIESDIEKPQPFKSWEVIDPFLLPRRDFIYGNFCRGYCSLTVSPGGVGKSTLALSQAISCSTGNGFLGVTPQEKLKVIYYNSEDPIDELQRRTLAVLQHFKIEQQEIENQLFLSSGRDVDLVLVEGIEGIIKEDNFETIESFCKENKIDLLILDPLANMTSGSPESNEVFKDLGKRLSQLADKCNLAIEIIHHTRKLNGRESNVEDARGGSSLVASVRSAKSLSPMDKETGLKLDVEHSNYFSVNDGKSNLRPLEKQVWFEKLPVELVNGDSVAICQPWEWPDVFSGVTKEQAKECQSKFTVADPKYRQHSLSNHWAGIVLAEVLGLDVNKKSDKNKITGVIKGWLETDVLRIDEEFDTRQGKKVKIIISGDNRLTSHE